MNLSALTETVQCKACLGYPVECAICAQPDHVSPHKEVTIRCPRCSDHPGIDPDVVSTIRIESGYHYSSARPVVVVPLEDTDDN